MEARRAVLSGGDWLATAIEQARLLAAAALGRLVWRVEAARRGVARPPWWGEVLLCLAAGWFGKLAGQWAGLDGDALALACALAGYLGPRGVEALLERWILRLPPGRRDG